MNPRPFDARESASPAARGSRNWGKNAPIHSIFSAESGAVLVEALIVIASFIMLLLLVLYMNHVFGRELQVQRAARAVAFAYAEGGCDDQNVMSLISAADAKVVNAPDIQAGGDQTMAKDSKIGDSRARNAFGSSSKNNGLGMPDSASVGARGEASMGNGLSVSLSSRTTLLCNEKPKSGEIDGIIDYMKDFF